MTSHAVGHYSVFNMRKVGEQPVYQLLYAAAVKMGEAMLQGENFRIDKAPGILRETWEELGSQVTIPFENEIPQIKGSPTPELLNHLIDVVKRILCEFGYFGNYPKTETIPPAGNSSPLIRLIRLTDPGFIRAGAGTHYHLLANLLEHRLTENAGLPVFFHVKGVIQPQDEAVYFEIGLVESYYLDLSIVEDLGTAQKLDPSKDTRFYLDAMKKFFSMFLRMKIREYFDGDVLHYEAKLLDNQQIDEFFAFRAKSLRKNKEIFQKLHLKTTRKWVPYEDWLDAPFLVVDFVTNAGFSVDDYFQAISETFPSAGYNIAIENLAQGKRINFMEPFDFDILFLNQFDEAATRAHYRALGVTSEEFLAERKQSIQEILADLKKKRLDKLAQKRKKLRERSQTEVKKR